MATGGCAGRHVKFSPEDEYYNVAATQIEYPDAEEPPPEVALTPREPYTLKDTAPPEYWDLTLQEAVQISLTNSRVLRDLGGTVPQAPHSSSARSIHFRFSGSRLPRDCHQTHVWQTAGAVSSVAPVSPASRDVTALQAGRRSAPRRRRRSGP